MTTTGDHPGRFLFVVPPLTGHINPTIAVGGELLAAGHSAAWVGYREILSDLLPSDRSLIPVASALPGPLVETIQQRASGLRGAAALKFLWEDFLHPLAEDMVDGIEAAIDQFEPDVVVVDQQTFAGALVAERRGLPWVSSATTSAELVDPFEGLPRIREWADDLLVQYQRRHGILDEAPSDPTDATAAADRLRYSPHLTLAFTTRVLVGDRLRTERPIAFVGPATTARLDPTDFPWDRLDPDRREVLVSLGTVNAAAGTRFLQAAADGLGDLSVTAIVVADPAQIGPVPENVIVQARVPQLALLERASAVVSHAGHNTVCETLANGIPMVLAPIRDDQPVIADQVVRAGAGIRIRFARCSPATVADAVRTALEDPDLRSGAETVARSFADAGGAPAAARHLIDLAHRELTSDGATNTIKTTTAQSPTLI